MDTLNDSLSFVWWNIFYNYLITPNPTHSNMYSQGGYPPAYGQPNASPTPPYYYNQGAMDTTNAGMAYPGVPMYGNPQMQPAPVYVVNQNCSEGKCPFCNKIVGVVERTKVGTTAILWGLALFCFTGCLCCIPCCVPDCLDKEYVCINCNGVRSTKPAHFFWSSITL